MTGEKWIQLRQTIEDRDATIRVLRKRIKNLQRMANITITVEMPRAYATHLRQAIHHAITSRPDVFDQQQIDILNDASARLGTASDESFAEQYADWRPQRTAALRPRPTR